MPAIETIAKPRGNRISVSIPKEYSSYSFQVILVPIRPEEPSVPAPAPHSSRKTQSLADALLSSSAPGGDDWEPGNSRADDPPSFFERSGGFSSGAFA